ncbi:MAG: choice-of-anchor D domain-containing protein [Bryobacteraceae bacterium]
MRRRRLLALSSITLILASAALAQATAPFTLQVQLGPNRFTIADGGTITLPADAIGLAASALVTMNYVGTGTYVIVNSVDLTGHADFSVTGVPDLPATLMRNQSLSFSIRYLPTSGATASGRVAVSYTDGRTLSVLTINLVGVAPDFAFSYIPPGGNATPLAPGGAVSFPPTSLNTTATATFILTNRGSGAGKVNNITGGGGAFQLAGLPLPPVTVDAGKDLRFSIQFTPSQLGPSQGSLQIEFIDRRVSFNLQGSGSGALYAYEVVSPTGSVAVAPSQAIALPDASVGDKSSVTVRVRNSGNADGTISVISVQGTGFALADLPFLPLTLAPGASATLTITFSPAQPGRATGRLRIGADAFDLTGNGLGATLVYSYAVEGVSTAVQPGGTVVFTPAAVGRSSSVDFIVTNTGTAAATINSITLGATSTPFTLVDVPALPATLAPGASLRFTVQFAPTAVGVATATLKIDTQSFTLSGSGGPPAPLPSYRFIAPTGSLQPMQQVSVGLALDAPYPLPLTGTLTLTFNSDVFSPDPAVQFATGGRTVSFTIPANTTRALFAGNATEIRLQTGTVAGSIVLTPSFATQSGIDLTPVNPPALSWSIPQTAPRLLSVALSSKASNTLTLLVSGYSTSRSITQMDFQFTAVEGENLGTTKLTLNAEPSFLAWYQSTTSQQYGSLFTATVPFTLQGDVKNVSTLADAIQSISVTLSNRLGTSSSVTISLR